MTPRPHTSTLFPYTTLFRSPPGRHALIETKEHHVTSVSRRLAKEAERIIPGGVNSATRNIGAPWAWKSARGATITDLDGGSYTDYHAAFGAILLGQDRKSVV